MNHCKMCNKRTDLHWVYTYKDIKLRPFCSTTCLVNYLKHKSNFINGILYWNTGDEFVQKAYGEFYDTYIKH